MLLIKKYKHFIQKYLNVCLLQKGKYSNVYMFQNYETGEYVSVKVIKKPKEVSNKCFKKN